MNDFDLSRRLREARPDLPRRGDALNEKAEATLRSIVSEADAPRDIAVRSLGRSRPALFVSVAAAVILLLTVSFGITIGFRPDPVYATSTPPLLQPTPVEGTAKELLMQLSRNLSEPMDGTIRAQSWSLELRVGADHEVDSVAVEPIDRVLTHTPEGSRIEERRGTPYDSFGNPIQVEGYQVGELIWEADYAPGEYPFGYPTPPSSPAEYAAYFQSLNETPITAGDVLRLVSSLLIERKLSVAQTRSLMEYLATLPDLRVEGRVTDRLGRTGIVFAADSRTPGEYVDRIIISDEGLGFLSYETTYVGTSRTDIQAPAVVTYTAWE